MDINSAPHISELWVYPVKSLGGIRVNEARITPQGLAHDRRWMVIDEQGVFITQRKAPQMGLIKCDFHQPDFHQPEQQSTPAVQTPSDSIKLTAPNGDHCIITPNDCQSRIEVKVWADTCEAFVAPEAINTWLNEHIAYKSPLKLVYMDPCFRRSLDTQRFGQHNTGFADGSPILLANTNSLRALNATLSEEYQLPSLEMPRFRPNIVLEGLPAFAEHTYNRATLNGSTLHLVDKCQRCVMISLSPSTAERAYTHEIFAGLSHLNSMPDNKKAPAFGVNCTVNNANTEAVYEGLPVTLTSTPL